MSNYDEETTAEIIAEYKNSPTRETVEEIAKRIGRSTKSVIGKLSREGVYRRESYTTKTGEKPITKVELLHLLAEAIDIPLEKLEGLEKAPKPVLKTLLEASEKF